jgi:hypothetical protein
MIATLTDAVVVAIIASIPLTLTSIGTLISSIRNSKKLAEIHTLTNSNLSKVTAQLAVANEKIDGMRELITLQASEAMSTAIASKQASDATERRATERQSPPTEVKGVTP